MNTVEAKSSTLKLHSELFSLNPSTLITLFEIDASDLAFDQGLITDVNNPETMVIFRFHNNINTTRSHIMWRGNTYIAAPVAAEGFDINSKGTLPTPKLSISVTPEGIDLLAILKQRIKELNNLVGAKVTRIRTFAKYLDVENFYGNTPPDGFDPDPNVEFPRDIYFIDRKSNENKYGIELELASVLDVEGVMLPLRLVVRNRCTWTYRGYGCLYEYAGRRTDLHGIETVSQLPPSAPPVANDRNELIYDLIGGVYPVDRGKWASGLNYNKGDTVFLEKGGIKYYFVAKVNNPAVAPPNLNYWIADQCAKDVTACKLRWGNIGARVLPFGGFPGVGQSI